MRRLMGVFVCVCFLGLASCTDFLAERMVAPPNGGVKGSIAKEASELRIPVGPPEATLAAWVMEPKGAARGTILALHGIILDHSQLEGPARALVEAGYRVVLVDLRGHGKSTGEHITYGVIDSRDLVQAVDYLQGQHLCGEKVGVLGVSYGAATALQFAARDPRVTTVVAVAPFASLKDEAPYFGKHLLPIPALFFSDQDFANVLTKMGKIAAFNPDDCSPVDAITKTKAHVRLFHGQLDLISPSSASEQLAAAAPERTELTLFPVKGHLDLCFDVMGELRPAEQEWFDKYLAAGTAAAGP